MPVVTAVLQEIIMEALSSYPTLFALCIFIGFPVPFPEDIVVMTAGTQVGEGSLRFVPTAIACGLGMYIRDVNAFMVAHHYRDVLVKNRRVRKFLGERTIQRWERIFDKYGALGIFLIRFAVGTRVKLLFIAAALGVRRRTFLLYDFLGMLIVAPLLVWLGLRFGNPVIEGVKRAGPIFTAAVAVAIAALLWFQWRRRKAEDAAFEASLVEESGDGLDLEGNGD